MAETESANILFNLLKLHYFLFSLICYPQACTQRSSSTGNLSGPLPSFTGDGRKGAFMSPIPRPLLRGGFQLVG